MGVTIDDLKILARKQLDELELSNKDRERYEDALIFEEKQYTNQGVWEKFTAAIDNKVTGSTNPKNLLYAYLLGISERNPMLYRFWQVAKPDKNSKWIQTIPGVLLVLEDDTQVTINSWQIVVLADGSTVTADKLQAGQEVKVQVPGRLKSKMMIRNIIRQKKVQWEEITENWYAAEARFNDPEGDYSDEFDAQCETEMFTAPVVVRATPCDYYRGFSNDVPDVDIDFTPKYRDAIKVWIRNEFGEDKAVSIINYNTFKLKSALKDVARVYEVDYGEVNTVTSQLDQLTNFEEGEDVDDEEDLGWQEAVKLVPALGEFEKKYPHVVDIARRLIGRRRATSMHASGVVISSEAVNLSVPLIAKEKKSGKEKVRHIIAAYGEGQSRSDLKTFGQVKFDVLGLSTLNDIRMCTNLLYERYGFIVSDKGNFMAQKNRVWVARDGEWVREYLDHVKIGDTVFINDQVGNVTVTGDSLPFGKLWQLSPGAKEWSDETYLDDPVALRLASSGATLTVFQFDSPLVRRTTKNLQPTTFEDMCAITTIIRPGAMGIGADTSYISRKHGQEEWESITPGPLLAITKHTYGLPIYQEQIMLLLNQIGKIPLPDCEKIRKAMSQKKEGVFAKYKEAFIQGAIETCGWTREQAEEYWGQTEPETTGLMAWASYGFNRCITPDSVVERQDGNFKLAGECIPGDMLKSYDPETGEAFYDEVIQLHDNGEKEVFEIELDNGMTQTCTMDHEFVCEDGQKHRLHEILEKNLKIMAEVNA